MLRAAGVAVTVPARAHATGVRLDLLGTLLGCGGTGALVYGPGQAWPPPRSPAGSWRGCPSGPSWSRGC